MKTMTWLLRREFWEHKGAFLWAPVVLAGVMMAVSAVTIAFGMSSSSSPFNMQVDGKMSKLSAMIDGAPAAREMVAEMLAHLCLAGTLPLFIMLSATTFFYCLGALHDERRDRSILFWKSLPLSDTQTVLSKALAVAVVAPLIVIGVSMVTSLLMLIIIGTVAAFHGVNVFGAILSNSVFYMAPLRTVGMLPVYLLWALPTVGWLLMVSAWARSKVFLWAVGVPVIALMLVKWIGYVLGTESYSGWLMHNVIGRALFGLVPGSWLSHDVAGIGPGMFKEHAMTAVLPRAWASLAAPEVWIAAAAGALMIYAAIRLRRFKDEG